MSEQRKSCSTCDWGQIPERLRGGGVPDRLCDAARSTPCYACSRSSDPSDEVTSDQWIPRRSFHPHSADRLPHSATERGLLAQFLYENARSPGVNHGLILVEHLTGRCPGDEISQEILDALASFAQWLGTPCGRAFLEEGFRLGGCATRL